MIKGNEAHPMCSLIFFVNNVVLFIIYGVRLMELQYCYISYNVLFVTIAIIFDQLQSLLGCYRLTKELLVQRYSGYWLFESILG